MGWTEAALLVSLQLVSLSSSPLYPLFFLFAYGCCFGLFSCLLVCLPFGVGVLSAPYVFVVGFPLIYYNLSVSTKQKDEMRLVNAAGHDNIHRMLGYCNEETGFYVVSESMTENLRNLISEKKKILAWEERVEIALACAKAMSALHSLPIPSGFVVFRSSKVLLDHDLRPKLCGFGVTMVELAGHGDIVSKALRQEKKGLYEAPEYRATGLRSTKTDVYSFGVVLGELFTGVVAGHRSPKIVNHTIVSFLKSNAELLGDFTADEREAVSGLLTEEYIIKRNEWKTDVKVFVDDELKEYPKIGAANILNLIGRCLDDDSDKRPTMEIVVKELGNLLWRFHGEK